MISLYQVPITDLVWQKVGEVWTSEEAHQFLRFGKSRGYSDTLFVIVDEETSHTIAAKGSNDRDSI